MTESEMAVYQQALRQHDQLLSLVQRASHYLRVYRENAVVNEYGSGVLVKELETVAATFKKLIER
jgi:hypothetical protein